MIWCSHWELLLFSYFQLHERAMFDSIVIVIKGFSWANPSLMQENETIKSWLQLKLLYTSLCQRDPLNRWEPATKVTLWRFFWRVLLLIVRRNGHKEVVKDWFREETIFPVAFWFLNLEIWLWKRLSFASTRPKRPMGGRPSRILGQGYTQAGTFWVCPQWLTSHLQRSAWESTWVIVPQKYLTNYFREI